jgi:hypothetical protein
VKSFGKTTRATPPAIRETFEFTVQRDGVDEDHQFTAVISLDFIGMVHMFQASKTDSMAAAQGMLRLVYKMLDNTDGVPNKWEPKELPRPKLAAVLEPTAWPPATGELDVLDPPAEPEPEPAASLPPVFRSPYGVTKGELLPMDRADEFLEHAAGSSRRRWRELCLDDDEVTVRMEAIQGLFEHLMGLAAGRPTERSSS